MAKKFFELNLNEIEAVVGGVLLTATATAYKVPTGSLNQISVGSLYQPAGASLSPLPTKLI